MSRQLFGLRTLTLSLMVDVNMSNESIAERIEYACKSDQWFTTFARPESVMASPVPKTGQAQAKAESTSNEIRSERLRSPVA